MNVRIGLLALSLVVLSAAGALAHGGKTHIIGTITMVDAEHLVIKDREGQSVSIHLTKDTTFRKGDAPSAAGDLKVGDRVVVDVVGKDADLTATEIRVAVVSTASAPVTNDNLMERLESAKTAADHEALAAYFRAKAAAARRDAKRHRAMLAAQPAKGLSPWHAHCTRLIKAYKKQAAAYDGLAAAQEKMAKDTNAQQ